MMALLIIDKFAHINICYSIVCTEQLCMIICAYALWYLLVVMVSSLIHFLRCSFYFKYLTDIYN